MSNGQRAAGSGQRGLVCSSPARRDRASSRCPLLVAGILALLLMGCLGTLPRDKATRAIVTAPRASLALPLHESRTHWLMRDLPRWCGAAEALWGGNPDDGAVATVRAVRFRDENAAARALDRLTPEYLAYVFRDRITDGPHPVAYPVPLPGDEAKVNEYGVRLPPEIAAQIQLTGQYLALRTGKALIITESIGLPPERLVPALEVMVREAAGAQGGC